MVDGDGRYRRQSPCVLVQTFTRTRYASFDYCFNYFQDARDAQETAGLARGDQLELSCLHLGFYLASWGMMRGRGGLHGRSLQELVRVVQAIADEPAATWQLDVPGYSETGIGAVLALADRIRAAYTFTASPVLVTKTMLGVFGCIPAFDRFFRLGFGDAALDRATLTMISDFYTANKSALHATRIPTLDFTTRTDTRRCYTQAKIIDMIFFQEGYRRTGKVRTESHISRPGSPARLVSRYRRAVHSPMLPRDEPWVPRGTSSRQKRASDWSAAGVVRRSQCPPAVVDVGSRHGTGKGS